MVVWMEVSADKYELPVVMADSAKELAKMCGKRESTIRTSASRYNRGKEKGRFCRYRSIKFEEC